MSWPYCLYFPPLLLLSLFIQSFSDSFQANPHHLQQGFRGAARPTSHSKPNTELEPTGSQVELLLLDVCVCAPQPGSKSIPLTFQEKSKNKTWHCLTFYHQNKKENIEVHKMSVDKNMGFCKHFNKRSMLFYSSVGLQ